MNIPKNSSADSILAAIRQNFPSNRTTVGNVSLPNTQFAAPGTTPPPGAGMTAQQLTTPAPGPRIYAPSPVSMAQAQQQGNAMFTPQSGGMASNSMMGLGFTPYVRSITPNDQFNTPRSNAGVSGADGDALASILAAFTGSMKKANRANEQRFAQAKTAQNKGFRGERKAIKGFGAGVQNQINENQAADVARTEQDAISRGLSNTTIRQGMISQANRRADAANLNLQDRLAMMKADVRGRRGAARTNLLASKFDNAPDPSMLVNLISQMNQNAIGGGGLASIMQALKLV